MRAYLSNLLLTFAIGALFIVLESVFRLSREALSPLMPLEEYATLFALAALLSLLKERWLKVAYLLLSVLLVSQVLHYNYFGHYLFPFELILFVVKFSEVYETAVARIDIYVEPLLYALALTALWIVTRPLRLRRKVLPFAGMLAAAAIIWTLGVTTWHYQKRTLGERPNMERSLIKNSLYLTRAFLAKTLPLYALDIHSVTPWQHDAPPQASSEGVETVVLVIGESLSHEHMGLYGNAADTTPHLSALEQELIIKRGIAAGVYTDSSIPMLLNMALRPNAIAHILSGRTNLFRLAKAQGYTTHWISAQSRESFGYIRAYMGLEHIDHYIDATDYGFKEKQNAMDDLLLQALQKIDLGASKHFIVLNMIGSHSPYELRVPQEFATDKGREASYLASVRYSDFILASIIEHLRQATPKALFLFTPDHGESIGAAGYGHGHIEKPTHYRVPIVLWHHNTPIDATTEALFGGASELSHYTLSLLCAHFLGYDVQPLTQSRHAFVVGRELSGNAGYLELDLSGFERPKVR